MFVVNMYGHQSVLDSFFEYTLFWRRLLLDITRVQTGRHSQDRKYITGCNATRPRLSHDRS